MINQSFLVTGAAGLLGQAVAKSLYLLGANLVLVDISKDKLNLLTKELELLKRTGTILEINSDITQISGINEVINFAEKTIKKIHGVVHCAYPRTITWGCSLEDLDENDLFANLSMQLGGSILLGRAVMQHFIINGGGTMVYVSSIQGVAAPKFSHYEGTSMTSPIEYSAVKAGIISMTKWLAKYYSGNNIRVNCVSPGGIIDNQSSQFLDRYRQSCTNYGMLSSGQVAEVITFLLSEASFAINGQNVIVDDGWTL